MSGVTSFNLCKMASHALHCTKFREIISNGIKVINTISILRITKKNNSAKNVGGATVVISACHLVMLYICVKFHEIISNGIKAVEWTQYLKGKLQRGIILQKM